MIIKRKLFASPNDEKEKKDNSKRNAAIVGGIGLAGTGAGAYFGGKAAKNKEISSQKKYYREELGALNSDYNKHYNAYYQDYSNDVKRAEDFHTKQLRELDKELKSGNLTHSEYNNAVKRKGEYYRDSIKEAEKVRTDGVNKLKNYLEQDKKELADKFSPDKLEKLGKKARRERAKLIGGIGLAATGLAAGGAYLATKKKNKNK